MDKTIQSEIGTESPSKRVCSNSNADTDQTCESPQKKSKSSTDSFRRRFNSEPTTSISRSTDESPTVSSSPANQYVYKSFAARPHLDPTEEQLEVLNYDLHPADHVLITGPAGSGKMTVASEYCFARPDKKFLIVCFNQDVAMYPPQQFPAKIFTIGWVAREILENNGVSVRESWSSDYCVKKCLEHNLSIPIDHEVHAMIIIGAEDFSKDAISLVLSSHVPKIFLQDSHQRIYAFRKVDGTELKAIKFVKEFRLTRSFRFGPEIARLADIWLKRKLRLSTSITSAIDSIIDPSSDGQIAVIYRSKFTCTIQNQIQAIVRLESKPCMWIDSKDFPDLGASPCYERDPNKAKYLFMTCHKAKGFEFDTVRLDEDIFDRSKDENVRVAYVAMTRAKKRLILNDRIHKELINMGLEHLITGSVI